MNSLSLKMSAAVIFLMGSGGLVRSESFVRVPAAPCIWSAAYEYKKKETRPQDPREAKMYDRMQLIAPKPKVKTVYITPEMQRVVAQWMMGRTTESWLVGDIQVFSVPNFPEGQVSYTTFSNEEIRDMKTAESYFPELSWLRPEYLVGKSAYQGTMANHYLVKKKPGKISPSPETGQTNEADPEASTIQQEAWINAKTGFPLAMENEAFRVTYKLSKETPSPSDMKMPPEYEKIWRRASGQP